MRGDDWDPYRARTGMAKLGVAPIATWRFKEALKIIKPDPERERECVNPNLLQYFRGSRRRLEWTN